MASAFISSSAEVVVIDSRARSGVMTLPLTNAIPYRILSFKDQYGTFPNSTFTLSTQVNESFDDGTTTKVFSNAFTSLSLYAVSTKWLVLNATQTVQQTISSLTVNQLTFGSGSGWVQFGALQASIVSSIQMNAQQAYFNEVLVGTTSTVSAVDYWGLFGNYNNTIMAEISTGGGTQELLFFKGSSTSDRFRFQTTGNFVVETGVSARLWSNTTVNTLSNVTPAFIINTSSNVGIQTATPATTLDVAGTGRFQVLSTLNIQVSTINGQLVGAGNITTSNLTSTTQGLGTIGYISTSQLTSTVAGLGAFLNITSTTQGLGTLGYISSSQLVSTTAGLIEIPELVSSVLGLGTLGYISSSQLVSTTAGLVEVPELVSSVIGLGTLGYISSSQLLSTTSGLIERPELVSSIVGLGTIGYTSTLSLYSTVAGLGQIYLSSGGAGEVTTANLVSTVVGLGTVGYISTPGGGGEVTTADLISTVVGLGTVGYISTPGGGGDVTAADLISSIEGLGTIGYISSSQLLSTTSGLVDRSELLSSIEGLGTIGYISSSQLLSTTSGLVDKTELRSSIEGLGTSGYVSSSQLTSSIEFILQYQYGTNISTLSLVASTLETSYLIYDDITAGQPKQTMFVSSALLYFGSSVLTFVSTARAVITQTIVF